MSADNGIYILGTPTEQGFEYRVIEAQCIDSIGFVLDKDGFDYSYGNPRQVVNYFQNSRCFQNRAEAFQYASVLYYEIMNSDFPILEYGISEISLAKPFSWYLEQEKIQPKDPWD